MKTYLVGDILTKGERASMAHVIEVRVPFLDHKLMEWVSGLPASFKPYRYPHLSEARVARGWTR